MSRTESLLAGLSRITKTMKMLASLATLTAFWTVWRRKRISWIKRGFHLCDKDNNKNEHKAREILPRNFTPVAQARKFGWGVWRASGTKMWFSLPYLGPHSKFDTLFQTRSLYYFLCVNIWEGHPLLFRQAGKTRPAKAGCSRRLNLRLIQEKKITIAYPL